MTSMLDFTIKYRWDNEQEKSEMFVSAPNSYKINKLSNSEPQIRKWGWNYFLIAILFLVHMEMNFTAIFDFFFHIYSSVMFISNSYS